MATTGAAARQPDPAWRGQASIANGWAAFLGVAGDNRPHVHHAVQVVVSFGGPVRLWTDRTGVLAFAVAVIPSDLRHSLLPSNTVVGLLYVDAESMRGRALQRVHEEVWSPSFAATATVRRTFEAAASGNEEAFQSLVSMLTQQAGSYRTDAQVAAVLERLHASSGLGETTADMAAWANLSASRFAHRFRNATGMPVRPYLRWLKLQRAAGAIVRGASVTAAAHAAGFADGAHLSRTFRRHFGISPSMLARLDSE